jgi:hypothetical protein
MLQVECKHCGQKAEVEDLLAAAEQPCPHCGKPLLDDAPPVTLPAAASGQPSGLPAPGCIVISRADALKTPPKVCIVCGAAATQVAHERIYLMIDSWNKFVPILVPYCNRHYRNHLLWFIVSWCICGVVCAFVLFGPHVKVTDVPPMVWLAVGFASVLSFILVYSRIPHVGFFADENHIEVSGASAQYINAILEQRARHEDGDDLL